MTDLEVPSLEELEAELALRRLGRFIPTVSPHLEEPSHLEPLFRHIELAADGIPQRVCCSAPPRHAKTESVLHVPAFVLRRFPERTLSYSTYGDRLSRSKSRKARRVVHSLGIETTGSVNEWRTHEGGGLLAGGVGGPLTGHGVDIAFVDDPYKNRMEAESAVRRGAIEDWYRDVLRTRIEPHGSIFVFATRWHPDDLIGLLTGEGFTNINLPALSLNGAPSEDDAASALWPSRWSAEAMRAIRDEVGEYTWASLYQGIPRPRGARVFDGVHTYSTLPTVYRQAGGVDSAYSEKKTADYSAYVVMRRHGSKVYVVDAWRGREPSAHFKSRLRVVHEGNSAMRWRWYVATSELGAASLFAEGEKGVPVHGEVAKADKFIRALRYAAAWNRGDVLVPESAPWLNDFLEEHAGFTGVNDKRDDFIDAAVAAWDEVQNDSTPPSSPTPTRTAPLRAIGM